jgi:hypothetical protein
VWHHTSQRAQAFYFGIERLHPLLRPDPLVRVGRHLVDRRLLDLHQRRAGVGERVILAVQRRRQVHEQLEAVLVMLVGQHQGENLRRDRADLHGPVGHRRDCLISPVELQ